MQLNEDTALKRLSDMNMVDMPVREVQPKSCVVPSDWFVQYKKLRHKFIESLTDSIEELAFMNLTQDEFMGLITGKQIPQNLSIRFRIPLTFGGQLEINNLFMCWTFPYSQKLDQFIIEQNDAKTVWLPDPKKKIYVPSHTASGGDGGNATEDRLSQMAAQIAASRGMEQ